MARPRATWPYDIGAQQAKLGVVRDGAMHRYASLDLDIVSDSSTTDKQSGESGRPRTLSLNLQSIYSLSTTLTHADAEPCRSVHHDSGANTCPRVPRAGVQLHDGGHTHATAMNTPLLAAGRCCGSSGGPSAPGVKQLRCVVERGSDPSFIFV